MNQLGILSMDRVCVLVVRVRVFVGIKVGHTAAAPMIRAGMDDTVCL